MSTVIFDSACRYFFGAACFGNNTSGEHGGWVGLSIYESGGATSVINSIDTYGNAVDATAGRLIFWPGGTVVINWNNNGDNSATSNNELTVSAPNRTASASGNAAEFLYFGSGGNNGSYSCLAIAGTISTVGGGGDIVISDTNIVSGQSYRLQNIRFDFFKDFTY